MPEVQVHHLLATAMNDVLETMFFSESLGPAEQAQAPALQAQLAFSGVKSGTVAVRVSRPSARVLAASFLGESEESLSDAQIAQVVCELANILCGSIVTRIEPEGCFDLGTPRLVGEEDPDFATNAAMQQTFAIDRGTLTVALAFCEPL